MRVAYQGVLGLGLILAHQGILCLGLIHVYFCYEFACQGRSLGLLTKV
jgi:hypothetical protein